MIPVPGDRAGDALEFTRCQARLLEFVEHVPRARVAGVAGSGKTVVALEHVRRTAARGRSTLLLGGGRVQAAWLREALGTGSAPSPGPISRPSPGPGPVAPHVDSFLGLCRSVAEAAGAAFELPEEPGARAEFLEWGAPELLAEHAEAAGARFDAIVVDGAQDFLPDWWDALEGCLAPGASLHAFYDEAQDVYGARGIGALDALPRFELRRRLRAPDGPVASVEVVPDATARHRAVEALATRWLGSLGIPPARAAVLAPWPRGRTCLANARALAGVPLVEDVDGWRAGRGLLVTTIRAFRGLEADAVAMIDLPAPDEAFGPADLHVGRSRARRLLHLVAASPKATRGA